MLGTQVIAAKSVSTVLSGLSFSCAMAFSAAKFFRKFISRRRYRTLKKVVIKVFNITQP